MTNPIWKKVTEVEPGLYWVGGYRDAPYDNALARVEFRQATARLSAPCWYARIGDIPPEPVMPPTDLKEGDPVMVSDYQDAAKWFRKRFARWSLDGKITTWVSGCQWTSSGEVSTWNFWKFPTEDELNQ